jgi:hypothetical protein
MMKSQQRASARDSWLGSLHGPRLVFRGELQRFLNDLASIEDC